ncbi:MAG TPA: hypothetical protein VLF09_11960 [Cellvibrio sp.]|nr:hypothetical protein [Cellvibrio sp.]
MRTQVLFAASLWLFSVVAPVTNATEIVPVDGDWYAFDVDPLFSQSGGAEWIDAQVDDAQGYVGDGSALVFSFSLTAARVLNVVDAGISGDIFSVLINGVEYSSSAVAADSGLFAGVDFDSAWAANEFSRLSVWLAPGDYTVSGLLTRSAIDDAGEPYMASVGGLRISEVNEPGMLVLLGLALGLLGLRKGAKQ